VGARSVVQLLTPPLGCIRRSNSLSSPAVPGLRHPRSRHALGCQMSADRPPGARRPTGLAPPLQRRSRGGASGFAPVCPAPPAAAASGGRGTVVGVPGSKANFSGTWMRTLPSARPTTCTGVPANRSRASAPRSPGGVGRQAGHSGAVGGLGRHGPPGTSTARLRGAVLRQACSAQQRPGRLRQARAATRRAPRAMYSYPPCAIAPSCASPRKRAVCKQRQTR
jgi:hypothetical protein